MMGGQRSRGGGVKRRGKGREEICAQSNRSEIKKLFPLHIWRNSPRTACLQGRVPKKTQQKQASLLSLRLLACPQHLVDRQKRNRSMYTRQAYTDITITQIKKGVLETAASPKGWITNGKKPSIFLPRQAGPSKTLGHLYSSSSLLIQKHSDIYVNILESKSTKTPLDT